MQRSASTSSLPKIWCLTFWAGHDAGRARKLADDPFAGKLLFAAKEAVYKAVYPLDGTVLDYHDIEVDLAARKATVRNGRVVDLRFGIATHLVALAFIPAARG